MASSAGVFPIPSSQQPQLPTIVEEKSPRGFCSPQLEAVEDGIDKLWSRVGCRSLLSSFLLACRPHHSRKSAANVAPAPSPKHPAATMHMDSADQPATGVASADLLKQQKEVLEEKQEAIDVLEWQVEQLQGMAAKEKEVLGICCAQIKEADRDAGSNNYPVLGPDDADNVEAKARDLLLEMALVRATLAIRKFCKVFMKQMEVSGYSVWRALAALEPGTRFVKKAHTVFVLESRVNRVLFRSFESESFDELGITTILDPRTRALSRLDEFQRMKKVDPREAIDPASSKFDPEFTRFCEDKTQEIWGAFPWNITFSCGDDRGGFTTAFVEACKGVWLLHRLAFSMNPVAGILRVGNGMEIDPMYVEAVVGGACSCTCGTRRVDFMVMPGFRTEQRVIKCQVYPHVDCQGSFTEA